MNSIELKEQILSRNKLDSMHWTLRYKYSQRWGYLLMEAFKGRIPKAKGKMKLKIKSLRSGTLDHDNLVGGCKGLIDALVRLKVIVDDAPEFLETVYEQERVKKEEQKTIIEFNNAN